MAADLGLDRVARYELKLATAEAVTSSVRHAAQSRKDTIHIRVTHDGPSVTFHVIDAGDFNGPPELQHALPDRGRRLSVIARFADQLRMASSAQGTVVSFSKRLA